MSAGLESHTAGLGSRVPSYIVGPSLVRCNSLACTRLISLACTRRTAVWLACRMQDGEQRQTIQRDHGLLHVVWTEEGGQHQTMERKHGTMACRMDGIAEEAWLGQRSCAGKQEKERRCIQEPKTRTQDPRSVKFVRACVRK